MNARLLPGLLLAALVAGCVAPPPADDAALAAEATPLPTLLAGLAYSDCHEQFALFPVPMRDARGYAPEGFTVNAVDPAGLTAGIFFIFLTCKGAAVENGTALGEVGQAILALDVTPPDELKSAEEGAYHAVIVRQAATSADVVAAFASWGVPTVEGEVVTTVTATPVARMGTASVREAEGGASVRVLATDAAQETAGLVRLFAVEDDALVGAYDLHWGAASGHEGEAFFDGPRLGPFAVPRMAGFGALWTYEGEAFRFAPVAIPAAAADPAEG